MGSRKKFQFKLQNFLLPLVEVMALGTWGVLLLKYWLTGQLNLLIHPNYFGLAIATGFFLLIVSVLRTAQLLWARRQRQLGKIPAVPVAPHITLFPPGWSSLLLLAAAIAGLIVTPTVFASDTAIQRGITDSVMLTRTQPQSFRSVSRPEERNLVEWIRTLGVYPEPDAYVGQKVNVQGFVVHTGELPSQYFLISRFVITCCAADAYPVGLPVKLTTNRNAYPPDTWLEVEGQMITETLAGRRQLTIEASSLEKIEKPADPYFY
jgi:uncharacterized repeat protein (TIGR03943 family)